MENEDKKVQRCIFCGGELPDQPEAVCEKCGCRQFETEGMSEEVCSLYEKADGLRLGKDYDAAAAIYQEIVMMDPLGARAYWSLFLCRYGVEYQEDPESGKTVPSVTRNTELLSQDDADYQSALLYGSFDQRDCFEKEFGRISGKTSEETIEPESPAEEQEITFVDQPLPEQEVRFDNPFEQTKDDSLEDLSEELSDLDEELRKLREAEEENLQEDYEALDFYLNDQLWNLAEETADHILRDHPADQKGLLGKLLAQCKAARVEDLKNCPEPFEKNRAYQKLILTADAGLVSKLKEALAAIHENHDDAVLEAKYLEAVKARENASFEADYLAAAKMFEALGNYKDSGVQKDLTEKMAQDEHNDSIYRRAVSFMKGTKRQDYLKAAELFRKIPGHRDADAKYLECRVILQDLPEEKKPETAEERKDRKEKEELQRFLNRPTYRRFEKWMIPGILIILLLMLLAGKWAQAVESPENKYQRAIRDYQNGELQQALKVFDELNGYRDSGDYARQIYYDWGMDYLNEGDLDSTVMYFEESGWYKDSKDQLDSVLYDQAQQLYDEGSYAEAIEIFESLGAFKDSTARAAEIRDSMRKNAEVGQYVLFGSYEQDNDDPDGKEDIEWLILAKDGNTVLAISRYVLDSEVYFESRNPATWQTSKVRDWLNTQFYETAFTEAEKERILLTTVSADPNPMHDTPCGADTEDKVFLLSAEEAKEYLTRRDDFLAVPTEYAMNHGIVYTQNHRADGRGTTDWWLRTAGRYPYYAVRVDYNGSISYFGYPVDGVGVGVRPVIRFTLPEE